ncbi:MAG: nuclear transport factor 2 family protein [Alphaproteobacteria bacterium]
MATIEDLEKRLNLLEAESAVRKLQYAYGYYLDKCLYNEVIDLYTDDGECKFMGAIYRGKPSLKRLYLDRFGQGFTKGTNRNVHGFLLDHAVMQFIVDVAPDGNSAKIRGRTMMQCGTHESVAPKDAPLRQWWEGGIYENSYRKDGGVWKIWKLHYYPVFHADFETGWAKTRPNYIAPFSADPKDLYPNNPSGPDEVDNSVRLWPHTDIVPFHYVHPVTGKPWTPPPRLP